MSNEYGLTAEFLYRYLNGSSASKTKARLSRRSGTSDIRIMQVSERVLEVTDTDGEYIGWSNGHVLFCENMPAKRPAGWHGQESASAAQIDDFSDVREGEGKKAWPVAVAPWDAGKAKAVKFATADGEMFWVDGRYLSALLKRLGRKERQNRVFYRLSPFERCLAVYDSWKLIGLVMPLDIKEDDYGEDAEMVVKVQAQYHPCPVAAVVSTSVASEPVPVIAEPVAVIAETDPTPEPETPPVVVTVPEPPKTRRSRRPVLLNVPEPEDLPSPAFYVVAEGYHERSVYL